ncbi:MAG: MBL fold metallo-hydrolase [Planctomycetota bacterium]
MSKTNSFIRFIFLGTGTSGGIPIIACDCPTCTSDNPKDNRTRQGAALQWIDPTGQHRTVLLDTTPDLRLQAIRHDLQRCDAILFTHHHVDHIFGLDEVRRFNAAQHSPIDIYAEPTTLEHLRRVYKHIFETHANENDSFVATLIPHQLRVHASIELFGVRFTPIRLMHGKLPILGFRIEAVDPSLDADFLPLAYCTDTSKIPTETWQYLEDLSTLVLDGLRLATHPTHFNIDQACDAAHEIDADQTWLVHLAHEVRHEIVDSQLPPKVNLAYDTLTLGNADFPNPRAGAPARRGRFAEG